MSESQPDKQILSKFCTSLNTNGHGLTNNENGGAGAGDDDDEGSTDEDFVCSDLDEDGSSCSEDSQSETDGEDQSDDGDSSLDDTVQKESLIEGKTGLITNGDSKDATTVPKIKDVATTSKNALTYNNIHKNECRICSVCLNEENNKLSDELLECDSCGFYIHEGCYGMSDSDSVASNASNASTEPWFCNSCLQTSYLDSQSFDLTKRTINSCELCPNTECGILKETESGRFVHILCALYIPGVAFQDTEKLWPVVLDEIPAQRWGEQACSLCEDPCLTRTGIVIKCDAGLCKTYFHVTCGLAHGFLVDPMQQVKQYESEPFLGYCKQHSESSVVKSRRTNYLAMISDFKAKNQASNYCRVFLKNEYKDRYLLKLKLAREDYIFKKEKTMKPIVNDHKVARMISTCPSSLKLLLAKNNVNSTDNVSSNLPAIDQQHHSTKSITFTADFVKYYFEREKNMAQNYTNLHGLRSAQVKLTGEELKLRNKYDAKLNQRDALKNTYEQTVSLLETYASLLALFDIKNGLEDLKAKYEIIRSDDLDKLDVKREPVIRVGNNMAQTQPVKRKTGYTKKAFKFTDQVNVTTLDALCINCKNKLNSHLLVDCDTCKNYYHINCLSPPLHSVPKKTKLYGWECSKCVRLKGSDKSDVEVDEADLDGPRSLRVKKPKHECFDIEQITGRSLKSPKTKKQKRRPYKKSSKRLVSQQEEASLMNKLLKGSSQSDSSLLHTQAQSDATDKKLHKKRGRKKKEVVAAALDSSVSISQNAESMKRKPKMERTDSSVDCIIDRVVKAYVNGATEKSRRGRPPKNQSILAVSGSANSSPSNATTTTKPKIESEYK